ncbi:hypothetical protein [Sphingobacterium corticibacter]|uniref:Uncharacterized protein n=1 Tax=Sphingobacterium corticibacter TaxID=2171749 RepID=A0A2T8HHH0_9SPHI|nr:hypothetical protein [Sphingobacterium corticibacter]PVH24881.1 hypothetical protein DC487_12250 [Sphingobacterium corticibacter]
MESIIPVLLVVGGLIYKIYQNYQEEMEKARKRQQNLPKKTTPKTVVATPRTSTAKRRETTAPAHPTPQPVYDRQLGRPKPTKIVRKPVEMPEKMVLEQEVPVEVTRLRAQKAKQKLAHKMELVNVADALPEQQQAHFDLRQAVIHAAILERPYAD